jgi:peptide/nickel transport system substrate-binding protein
MKKCFSIILAFILFGGLIFTSCSTSATSTTAQQTPVATTTKSPATTIQTPQTGGILKVIATPGILNMGVPGQPFAAGDMNPARCAVECLLDLDSSGNIIPWLATGWQFSSDLKTLTLTLRKGVKFHDGTDFNAQAVKYCLDLAKTMRPDLKIVTSIDVVDDYTAKLNLSAYQPNLLIGLTGNSGKMYSPTALQTKGDANKTLPVSTGPFKAVSYQRDVSLKFEKFNDYWQKGKPYLDGIEFNFIADAVTRLVSFKAGEAQVLATLDAKDAADLQATGKYVINKTPQNVAGIAGDSAHSGSPTSDIRVRQAIAYAIDNNAIAKYMGYGIYQATNQYSAPGHYSYNTSVVGYPYNPQKAKELLASAGYPQGFSIKFTCQQTAADVTTAEQGYLEAVGIKTTIDIADAGRWAQIESKGWSDSLIPYGISHSYGVDKGYSMEGTMSNRSQFYPSSSIYIPPEYDAKLVAANLEIDQQKRSAMIQDLMKVITDQYCIAAPVYVNFGLAAVKSPEVHNLDMNILAAHIWHPADAWLSK